MGRAGDFTDVFFYRCILASQRELDVMDLSTETIQGREKEGVEGSLTFGPPRPPVGWLGKVWPKMVCKKNEQVSCWSPLKGEGESYVTTNILL